ncbi:AEC family transporter [Stieleria varia]|uniref:Membrane transport protein n=1 Tax=Stieleria varia TaxID=2528005 RepID=A0A5C6ASZ2_9BACT|nr:AEC family transporter [Stieleria varia]TWU02668.1 Membrane transport protein [Stieleria varia]
MSEVWPIVASVLGVFLVMGVGAGCRQLKWLTTEADRTLANLTANVMLPAYFIGKFATSTEIGSVTTAWQPTAFGFCSTAFGFGIAYLIARSLGPKIGLTTDVSQRAFALCVGIANYGYIPLPLAEKFYPSAVIELILHNVGVDVALWSIGLAIISGSGGNGWRGMLKSAPLWAVLISVALSELGWIKYVPAPILSAIGAIGACAIPLGLLLSGAIIVDFLKDGAWRGSPRTIFAAIGVRQILLPLIMLAMGRWLFASTDLRAVVMLQAAMPAAVFPIVLTKLYEKDTETALRVVLWTSIAGLVLMPAWLAAGTWWMGL